MQKKALLLGSSYSASSILFCLKRRGIHVSVCGGLKDDPCHKYGDESFFEDYSDYRNIEKILSTNDFDYLVPTCNDFSYVAGATVAKKCDFLGFDDPEVTKILHTKEFFKSHVQEKGLSSPRAFKSIEEAHEFLEKSPNNEVLVKPTDSFSGKGVSRLKNSGELLAAVNVAKEYSRTSCAVIEEFVEGSLHSHSAFIQDGKIHHDFFVDEYCVSYPYQVDCSNHPSILKDSIIEGVRAEIQKLISSLNLRNGLLHTQFIVNNNYFWLIECMRRCPGDLFFLMVEYSTGHSYIDDYVKPFLGEKFDFFELKKDVEPVMRHTLSSQQELVFSNIQDLCPNRKLKLFPLKLCGEPLRPAPFDKAGIVFMKAKDIEEMKQLTPKLGETFLLKEFSIDNKESLE